MLKKLLTGGLAAGAIGIPFAGVAWADPPVNPGPPAVPDSNAQGSAVPAQPAAVPASNGQGPSCIVSANAPAEAAPGTQAAGTQWRQVATLQGSDATDLGLPPGQVVKVFCAPAGTQTPSAQATGVENPGQIPQAQPAGVQNPGQIPPAQQ
jgi:hypothetical protein